jgi:hypothetical protein
MLLPEIRAQFQQFNAQAKWLGPPTRARARVKRAATLGNFMHVSNESCNVSSKNYLAVGSKVM